MGSLTALLHATPIFGFSLQVPALEQGVVEAQLSAKTVAELRAADTAEASSGGQSQKEYVAELKQRNNIASIHRAFGIATWTSMTLTVAAGFLAYYNLYGFGADVG